MQKTNPYLLPPPPHASIPSSNIIGADMYFLNNDDTPGWKYYPANIGHYLGCHKFPNDIKDKVL